jgi:hypothetical protein
VSIYVTEELQEFCFDERGGKQTSVFYDIYPELEIHVRNFAVEGASKKDASFTLQELAEYVDVQYYLLAGEKKTRWHLSFAHVAKYGATCSPILGRSFHKVFDSLCRSQSVD